MRITRPSGGITRATCRRKTVVILATSSPSFAAPYSRWRDVSRSKILPDWRSNQIYLAHFTISDIDSDQFYAAERFSRGGAGLAGAQAEPYRVWLEDWSASEVTPGKVRIQADTGDVSLDILLTETCPLCCMAMAGSARKGRSREMLPITIPSCSRKQQGSWRSGGEF